MSSTVQDQGQLNYMRGVSKKPTRCPLLPQPLPSLLSQSAQPLTPQATACLTWLSLEELKLETGTEETIREAAAMSLPSPSPTPTLTNTPASANYPVTVNFLEINPYISYISDILLGLPVP